MIFRGVIDKGRQKEEISQFGVHTDFNNDHYDI